MRPRGWPLRRPSTADDHVPCSSVASPKPGVDDPNAAAVESTNRRTWVRWAPAFAGADAWTDKGERNAVMSLADEVRGGRILDVGVGAGRTTWLLRLLSDRYVAIDYTPEMVDLARQNHPDVDIRLGDARLLGDFTDRWFDLVVFSCNGIDAVSHVDRALVLNELARVLRPGGLLILSTMNKDGNAYGEVPWRVGTATDPSRGSLFRALKVMTVLPRTLPGLPQSLLNWRHNRQRSEDHGDWGIAPLAAHHFGLLIHTAPSPTRSRSWPSPASRSGRSGATRGAELSPGRPRPPCSTTSWPRRRPPVTEHAEGSRIRRSQATSARLRDGRAKETSSPVRLEVVRNA